MLPGNCNLPTLRILMAAMTPSRSASGSGHSGATGAGVRAAFIAIARIVAIDAHKVDHAMLARQRQRGRMGRVVHPLLLVRLDAKVVHRRFSARIGCGAARAAMAAMVSDDMPDCAAFGAWIAHSTCWFQWRAVFRMASSGKRVPTAAVAQVFAHALGVLHQLRAAQQGHERAVQRAAQAVDGGLGSAALPRRHLVWAEWPEPVDHVAAVGYASTCRCLPSPAIPSCSVSPALSKRGGARPTPTPGGVPVTMMSPGSSLMRAAGSSPAAPRSCQVLLIGETVAD